MATQCRIAAIVSQCSHHWARRCLSSSASIQSATDGDRSRSAAAHLLSEAQRLEAEEQEAIFRQLQRQMTQAQAAEKIWSGEEETRDAVLRMLMDKHKPLRVPGHQKQLQQSTSKDPAIVLEGIVKSETEDEEGNPLIIVRPRTPSAEAEKPAKHPWEVTYKKPDTFKEAKVRAGVKLAVATSQALRKDPGRLFAAREASLDYANGEPELAKAKQTVKRYNLPGGAKQPGQGALPTSIKGYVGFVEDRIERARQRGFFDNIKGKGKPMPHDPDASNPFIDTTERLMNRIVQRQGAAPPWIELQQELIAETDAWRLRLQESWRRRAVRMLSLTGGPPPSLEDVRGYRDPEWVEREAGYHQAGIRSLNNLLHRYNGAAPSSVRRVPLRLFEELEDCYMRESADIHAELERRHRLGPGVPLQLPTTSGEMQGRTGGVLQNAAFVRPVGPQEGLWPALKRALGEFRTMRL